ncbi:nucleoside recognition domain-containing protein [Aureibacter tunicatorum]|uniref:Spore maturation protein SpmA n=1 Tax=Aureibacter tunicatorum TaxID=866807 RepID=A0AAE3XN13_9BACT|nr:nucleoside recognition domain-containing protein [Aureibacter tunicatorum]MDR6238958.1 spore maturation protein SpmA [Aureibacter tunicatorum]BDD05116.1 membrane protein [Aureibacter tunicatorum]
MALNYIWISFFVISFVVGLVKLIFYHDTNIFPAMMESCFEMAKTGFELSLWLTGAMALWLGILNIGEESGIIKKLTKVVSPFFKKLFPEIPENHPVLTPMIMNFSANMLGLDNAATPLGLKTMQGLQELNPHKDKASNAQIMFLVLNTSGLTLIPISVMIYRQQFGAANPSDVFIPILLATFFSTLAGLISVSIFQKINLFDKTIIGFLGGMTLLISCLIYYFSTLESSEVQIISKTASNVILFGVIIGIILLGLKAKINVYNSFVEGAKGAFDIAITIIPYLIAMLVAIGVFRASGAMDYIIELAKSIIGVFGVDSRFVDSLPTAFMKPLSGSGARGMMVETMKTHGADSFQGFLSSIMQGSTETTLYVVALYFGAVKVRNSRHAITCGLIADAVGIIAAIFLAYIFFTETK